MTFTLASLGFSTKVFVEFDNIPSLESKNAVVTNNKVYIPLQEVLKAWYEGYEKLLDVRITEEGEVFVFSVDTCTITRELLSKLLKFGTFHSIKQSIWGDIMDNPHDIMDVYINKRGLEDYMQDY